MALRDWLERVLIHGESVQTEAPVFHSDPVILPLLESAYLRHAANVAGVRLPFQKNVAQDAARVLAEACWAQSSASEFTPTPPWQREPASAAEHLTADLLYRFLPGVLKRAKARDRESALCVFLEELLCKWPLSGVLADLDGAPALPPDFDGHAGLQMLYAERLLANPRAGWVPRAGTAYEWVERVFQDSGKPIPQERPLE